MTSAPFNRSPDCWSSGSKAAGPRLCSLDHAGAWGPAHCAETAKEVFFDMAHMVEILSVGTELLLGVTVVFRDGADALSGPCPAG